MTITTFVHRPSRESFAIRQDPFAVVTIGSIPITAFSGIAKTAASMLDVDEDDLVVDLQYSDPEPSFVLTTTELKDRRMAEELAKAPDAITLWYWHHRGLSSLALAMDFARHLHIPRHMLPLQIDAREHRPYDASDWARCQALVNALRWDRAGRDVDPLDVLPADHWCRKGVE
jgi:hypothetical protein